MACPNSSVHRVEKHWKARPTPKCGWNPTCCCVSIRPFIRLACCVSTRVGGIARSQILGVTLLEMLTHCQPSDYWSTVDPTFSAHHFKWRRVTERPLARISSCRRRIFHSMLLSFWFLNYQRKTQYKITSLSATNGLQFHFFFFASRVETLANSSGDFFWSIRWQLSYDHL